MTAQPSHVDQRPDPIDCSPGARAPDAGAAEAHAPHESACEVRLVDLHKSFDGLVVLDGLTMTAEAARTTVILGPSGVGKSVVLKHIAGLLKPDSGEVWVGSRRIDRLERSDLDDARRNMGFLFQLSALFDSMTVEENVAFPLREHERPPRKEISERVGEALRTVGLQGVEMKMPNELSGGQRKRVALARAIIRRPALMLYDEPTTGLDPVRADGIDQLINCLRDDMGVTGIAVTHDLDSARRIGDHIVMILGGRVAAAGTFEELDASEDQQVRRFLAGEYDPSFDEQAAPKGEAEDGVLYDEADTE